MGRIILGILCISSLFCRAQLREADSMRRLLSQNMDSKSRIKLYKDLSFAYSISYPDSCYYFASLGTDLSRLSGDLKNEAICLSQMSSAIADIGNIPKALDLGLKSLVLAEKTGDSIAVYESLSTLGLVYYYQNDFRISVGYFLRALVISKSLKDERRITQGYEDIGNVYYKLNNYDSAIYFTKMAYARSAAGKSKIAMADELNNLGDTYASLNNNSMSLNYYRNALKQEKETGDVANIFQTYLGMAGIFKKIDQPDSARLYAYRSMDAAIASHYFEGQMEAGKLISSLYESENKTDSALRYMKLTMNLKDSLFNQEKSKVIENMTFEENTRQQEIADQKKKAQEDHVRNLQLLAIGLFIPLFFLGVLFLSRTKVKPRVVEFLGIFSLLLFFEFITDLIYPFVSNWTNENPIWEMLILVILAALLEPLNNKLEHFVKMHLVHHPDPVPVTIADEGVLDELT